jgi:hypothetical protein
MNDEVELLFGSELGDFSLSKDIMAYGQAELS